ncbi:MAG: DNA-3-methyladenine glycosylase family protein, partial [Spirochaetota bacterium]
ISVAAAEGIWRRFLATYPSVDARAIASADPAALRAIGLSNRKVEYVTGIARAFAAGDVKPAQWSSLADDALRDHLTSLRGVGPWTADMVLIFHERRPDVLPLGDVGLVNAAARLYGWDAPDLRARRETLRVHAERWRPWRSVATWYIWLELDAEPVVY